MKNFFLFLILLTSSYILAEEKAKDPLEQSITVAIPWKLLVDRGKLIGCIYDNRFYSEGSILVEEGLPRKCKLDSSRDGFWEQLAESDLDIFETTQENLRELNKKQMLLHGKPLTELEVRLLSVIRRYIKLAEKQPLIPSKN